MSNFCTWTLIALAATASACSASMPQPANVGGETTPEHAASKAAFEIPPHLGPKHWIVLGPFPAPAKPAGQTGRSGMDQDFLTALGGESDVRLFAASTLTLDGKQLAASEVESKDKQGVDFSSVFKTDTDMKLAYAYGEFDVANA